MDNSSTHNSTSMKSAFSNKHFRIFYVFSVVIVLGQFYAERNAAFILNLNSIGWFLYKCTNVIIAVGIMYYPYQILKEQIKSKIIGILGLALFATLISIFVHHTFVSIASIYTKNIGQAAQIELHAANPPTKEYGKCKYSLNLTNDPISGKNICLNNSNSSQIKAGDQVILIGRQSIFGFHIERYLMPSITPNQALKAQPSAAGTPQSGAP